METKYCSKCKRTLQIDNFWIRTKKTKISRQSICKECATKRRIQYYKENKDRENFLRKKRKQKRKAWYIKLKQSKVCCKCGESRWYCLDFHHTDEKKENIANMYVRGTALEKIKEELEKCIVFCSNCHREHHHMGL